jgi:hypothetical protein
MAETVEQRVESGHVTRTSNTAFEPDILAFCCEH